MNAPNDGGPAFPFDHQNPEGGWINTGMTLRDYFAAQALSTDWIADYSVAEGAVLAYKYADAMIAERSKGGAS